LRSRIVIETEMLRYVTIVVDPLDEPSPGLRWPGIWLPGLQAGRFVGRGGVSFWLCGNGPKALRLDLSGHEFDYMVIQMGDCESVRDRIEMTVRDRQ
jgi:hypothetical protein